MPKSRTSSLSALAELLNSKAEIERRERDARHQVCIEIGTQVLASGLPIADLAEIETLLGRVKKLGMTEALTRLSGRSARGPVDASGDAGLLVGGVVVGRIEVKEPADVAA